MLQRRRISLIICLLFLLVVAIVLWLRPGGPSYKGQSVRDWFTRYAELRDNTRPPPSTQNPGEIAAIQAAFVSMGTNAVPYLAGRITQEQAYSHIDMLRF